MALVRSPLRRVSNLESCRISADFLWNGLQGLGSREVGVRNAISDTDTCDIQSSNALPCIDISPALGLGENGPMRVPKGLPIIA